MVVSDGPRGIERRPLVNGDVVDWETTDTLVEASLSGDACPFSRVRLAHDR